MTEFDDRLRRLVADMAETMYDANGIGLAATQVDAHVQLIVIDISDARDQLQVFINPRVVSRSPLTRVAEEGCLSVPGVYDEVERPESVVIETEDEQGNTRRLEAEGLLAVCVQHEMDHLNGKVFVEYLSTLKQTRIRNRMRKAERESA